MYSIKRLNFSREYKKCLSTVSVSNSIYKIVRRWKRSCFALLLYSKRDSIFVSCFKIVFHDETVCCYLLSVVVLYVVGFVFVLFFG